MNVTITDLAGQARGWAEQEIQRVVRAGNPGLGGAVLLTGDEEYGAAVTWVILTAPNQAGQPANLPVWFLAVTHASPLPGTPVLVDCQQIGSPVPQEEMVRAMAAAAVRNLRVTWDSLLAAGNGTQA